MPEYLSPGVYIEEFEIGAKPMEGVSTSTAGFLGETERGPTTPRLITSWLQYQRVYGGYFGSEKYLPGSVDGFFKNGGSRCYIGRIVRAKKAKEASLNLKLLRDNKFDIKIDEDVVLKLNAVGEGEWGNRIAVILSKATTLSGGIKLDVLYWKTKCPSEGDLDTREKINTAMRDHPLSVHETFDDVSISKTSSDYFDKTVNGISNLIEIKINDSPEESSATPCKNKGLYLKKGRDDTATEDALPASLKLQSIEKIIPSNSLSNKVWEVEATEPGKKGNSIGLKLSPGNEKAIKLEIKGHKTYEGDKPEELIKMVKEDKNSPIKITSSDNKYKDAKEAFDNTKKLDLSKEPSTPASITLHSIYAFNCEDFDEYKGKILTITAIKPDTKDLSIQLEEAPGKLKLKVFKPEKKKTPRTHEEGTPEEEEETIQTYEGETPEELIEKVNAKSELITISIQDNDQKEAKKAYKKYLYLEGGKDAGLSHLEKKDYTREEDDKPGKRKGLTAFKGIEDISIVYAPNAVPVSGLVDALISHCENLRYRFAILDSKQARSEVPDIDPRSDSSNGFRPTDYAAFYYPWIKVANPDTGMLQLMPPGGYVAGIYARSDTERGVHKAPANEIVKGASDLEFQIMKGEQDVLNPRGVNVIRAFPGRGILVWGARTLSSNTLWKYINVRRLFIYVEASIEKGTQWVVFEPNDDRLWARVKATINQFLTGVWRSGALMGTTPEEAFFIKCDRSTMTQDDIDNGRLICIIGIAPVKPAEFVIFRIAQWQGGSAATE